MLSSTQFANFGGFRDAPNIPKTPTYINFYRGTNNPADQSALKKGFLLSNAMKEGIPPTKQNTGFFAKIRHSIDSSNPPSQFVSLTTSRTTAANFGRVFEFQVNRTAVRRAWWSPLGESEYLAPGGTLIFNLRENR